ncbi:DUF3828 domain-containing protein [Roseomonas genomospecies 6]|uniref:DUF3828 domain-containing protein n=1 Tax=Roseomonas genomospecies 6 TaxID=214106 RepID=A0A9W7KPT7_9PROT|nr:DUF3828 domain-containing protein [Roseomonas genomospecies 6]
MTDGASKYRLRIWQGELDLVIRAAALEDVADLIRQLGRLDGDAEVVVETWDPEDAAWIAYDTLRVPKRDVAAAGTRVPRWRRLVAPGIALLAGAAATHLSLAPPTPAAVSALEATVIEPAPTAAPEPVAVPAPAPAPVPVAPTTHRKAAWPPGKEEFRKLAATIGVTKEDHSGMEGPWALPGGVAVAYWGQCGGSGCGLKGWTFALFRQDGPVTLSEKVYASDVERPTLSGSAVLLKGPNEKGNATLWTFHDGVLSRSAQPIPLAKLPNASCRGFYSLIESECAPEPGKDCANVLDSMSRAGMQQVQYINDMWPARGPIFDRVCAAWCRRKPVTLAQFSQTFCQVPADPAIERLLKTIYGSYLAPNRRHTYPRIDSPSELREVFSEEIVQALELDRKQNPGDVGVFDFNVFVDGQDYSLTKMPSFTINMLDAATARVLAVGVNEVDGKKAKISIDLSRTPAGWRITNIHWPRSGADMAALIRKVKGT